MFSLGWISRAFAQEVINGDLTVNGTVEINHNNVFLGLAETWDGSALQPAFGLTINYTESPPTTGYSSAGHSTLIQRAAQELATFKWQSVSPTTGAIDLMQVSNEGLTLMSGNFLSQGTANTLPNQTLTAGSASILTLGLADTRYLSKTGGTLTGNLTVNGQNVLTESTGIRVTSSGEITGGGASVTAWSGGIGIGGSTVSGNQAVGIGNLSYATGNHSVALGREANVAGHHAVGIGHGSFAAGNESIAIGQFAASHTASSIALGLQAKATQRSQIVLGSYNEMAPWSPDTPSPTDWLFLIGNGTAENARSNALVVRRNGDMEVKGTSLTVNGTPVMLESSSAYIKNKENVIIGGYNAYAIPWSDSIAIGNYAQAGTRAVSLGNHAGYMGAMVSGTDSTAVGSSARAPGTNATALGYATWAAGESTLAAGYGAATRSLNAIAIGTGTDANQVGQVVLGAFNVMTGPSTSPSPTDAIFILGNGTADNARSNALVVRRNGNMEVLGTSLTVNGAEVLTQAGASSLYVTQTAASAAYLLKTDAETLYQPKLPTNVTYLTTSDLTTIQTSIDEMIDADELDVALAGYLTTADKTEILGLIDDMVDETELATALANLQVAGDYLSSSPTIGLAYGTSSSAAAGTSAIGTAAVANQPGTHALGTAVVANRPGQIVIGNFNDYGETESGSGVPDDEDAVFVIGAGTDNGHRKNAIVVKRNGDTEVTGVLRVEPSGNLSMGTFVSGQRPVPTSEE